MADFVPSVKLYASNGTTLIYTFSKVVNFEDMPDPVSFVEHTAVRGQGSIISEGSTETWTLALEFIFTGTNYTDLKTQLDTLKSTIVKFTKYILKINKDASTTENFKVMRVSNIEAPIGDRNKRRTFQRIKINFLVDAWA